MRRQSAVKIAIPPAKSCDPTTWMHVGGEDDETESPLASRAPSYTIVLFTNGDPPDDVGPSDAF
ncbi:hypothetical protein Ancab_028677 [Ancistrocladus abbreviatus]